MNILDLLHPVAVAFPKQEIITDGVVRLTYARLFARARRLATGLAHRGVRPGDSVAFLGVNGHELVETFLATALCGAVFVPVNVRFGVDELAHALSAVRARCLAATPAYRDVVRDARARSAPVPEVLDVERDWEALMAGSAPWPESWTSDADAAAVYLFTSGTTARPKVVVVRHGQLTEYALTVSEMNDGSPRGSNLLSVPLYHVAGLTGVLTGLFSGRRLVLLGQFTPEAWLAVAASEGITHAFLVPTMLKRIVDSPALATADLSRLEVITYGGALMPLPVIRRAIERFPAHVGFANAYGQTETTSTVTILGPDDHRLGTDPAERERRLTRLASVGRAVSGVALRIVGDTGRPLAPGQVGEVEIHTARAMKGYLDQPDATRATVAGEWLRTGDLGWLDADGYLFLAGRRDDLIIRGGENISPLEVETTLLTHPAVEDAAVFPLPDPEWGQRVAAAVVLNPGASVTAAELTEHCRAHLASYKKPAQIFFVDTLPRNSLGKVVRQDLKRRFA